MIRRLRLRGISVLAGCLAAACILAGCPEEQPGDVSKHLKFINGVPRTYRLFVPSSYDGATPMPLVLALHGMMHDGEWLASVTALEAVAEEEGFILAFPDAVFGAWRPSPKERGSAGWGLRARLKELDDTPFIEAVVDAVGQQYAIDTSRTYLCGSSMGGFMAYCAAQKLSNRFAATAVVAMTMPLAFSGMDGPAHPMPLLVMHGTDDPVIPYEGGALLHVPEIPELAEWVSQTDPAQLEFLSAEKTIAQWAAWNGLACAPDDEWLPDADPADGTVVVKTCYADAKAEVVLYSSVGGGHGWPGSAKALPEILVGKTCRDVDASREIWQFFKRFTR